MRRTELLRLAASLEKGSEHPLAAAIVEGALARGITLADATNLTPIPARVSPGRWTGARCCSATANSWTISALTPTPLPPRRRSMRAEGQTVMFVAVDGKLAGLLAVSDPIKETTPEAIRQLHDEGIRIVMLTGDNRTTAEAVAKKLGIDEVVAEVLPDEKAAVVKKLQEEGRMVAMAGDGINDAPALAQAQVGIAMGTGTDVAMESAGVTLVKGDLTRHRPGPELSPRHHGQYQAEPVLRLCLQRARRAGRRRRAVSLLRHPAEPDDRGGGDELQLRLRHRQRPPVADGEDRIKNSRRLAGGAGHKHTKKDVKRRVMTERKKAAMVQAFLHAAGAGRAERQARGS